MNESYDVTLSKRTVSLATATAVVFCRSNRMKKYIANAVITDWTASWVFRQNAHEVKRLYFYDVTAKMESTSGNGGLTNG